MKLTVEIDIDETEVQRIAQAAVNSHFSNKTYYSPEGEGARQIRLAVSALLCSKDVTDAIEERIQERVDNALWGDMVSTAVDKVIEAEVKKRVLKVIKEIKVIKEMGDDSQSG